MVKPVLAAALLLLATIPVAADTIVVDSVVSGSPAQAAGLQDGDHLIELDDKTIASQDDLQEVIAAHQPGDTVPLAVEREGERVALSLTFGERPDGGVSIGVRLAIMRGAGSADGEPTEATVECLEWIDTTYRIEAMIEDLGLDFADDYASTLECVQGDTQRMAPADAVKYCDNVFKVHCSALDLLTEIGEAQVERCEEQLGASLGLKLDQYDGWKKCAEQSVFDRYSKKGEASDEAACRAALLKECGTNVDAAEHQAFVACCTADTLDGESCPMIDDGFSRGPCHDRPVCVNRLNSEWLDCSVVE
ncbi:MAG: PDZ domain-containing protein [Acidobacteriota bacterium]|nr:PDZ domain-containing protein [Acidobacteriota bacterium]MDH3785113.1 PDZ domain-containing protein [Acidobacteriota bacterium]